MIKTKTIKCKICRAKFEPRFNGHKWCSDECQDAVIAKTLEKVRANNAKAERKETRQRKEKLKGKADFKKEAQAVFNRFIRLRDAEQACISCGIVGESGGLGGYWDAGHYRSRGATPELAFTEDNCHKQCKRCNRQLSGNVVNYRIRLIERIGVERVEALECNHQPLRYKIEDYKRIKAEYSAKIKELKA
jgi:hypothetical protein